MRRQLTEDQVQVALGDLGDAGADGSGLDAATVAALRLVDCLTEPHPKVADDLHTELREHFDDGQILELATAISVAAGWQRFIEAFDIRPDLWSEATPLPWDADGPRRTIDPA